MCDLHGLSCASHQAKLSHHSGCFEILLCLPGVFGLLLQSPATLQLRSYPDVAPLYVIAAFCFALQALIDSMELHHSVPRNESTWGQDPHAERSSRNRFSLTI